MFKIKCRCGAGEQMFKHNIGPFYIDECCKAAGFDELGNKADEVPPLVPPAGDTTPTNPEKPVELNLEEANKLIVDDPEQATLDAPDTEELPDEPTPITDEPCFHDETKTEEFLKEEVAIALDPSLVPDPVFSPPPVADAPTVAEVKVKRTYTKKTPPETK